MTDANQTPPTTAADNLTIAPPPADAGTEPSLDELARGLIREAPVEEGGELATDDKAIETQPAPPVEKDEKAERVAARIAVARRAEMRAAQSRAELQATRAELDAKERDLAAKEELFRALEQDPVAAFEKLKLDPKKFLERLAETEGDTTSVIAKKLTALEQQLADERAAREQLERERQHRQQSAAAEAAWQEAGKAFIAHVGEQAETYPHLVAEFTETEALDEAFRVLSEPVGCDARGRPISRAEAYRAKYGEYPDQDVVAQHLDAIAKKRAEAKASSTWRKRNGDAPAQPSQGVTNGKHAGAQPVRGSSPRTLTSRAASERATAQKPWSQEAADEESLRILEAGFRTG